MNLEVEPVRAVDFGAFVRSRGGAGALVVQPRLGFGDPVLMRAGLAATKAADATTVGTITLDSYTRVGDLEAAESALREGAPLNGYPIVSHARAVTEGVLGGIRDVTFPVQVRHGSAMPGDIFTALIELGIPATEGGPVSYCLPYGRTPLAESVRNWAECCRRFAALRETGVEPHLETFGGCLLGQLCPPSQLVAMSVLEALFFHQHGLRSISVSYAQQTNLKQDVEAVLALQRLCAELVPTGNLHIVVYAYMGVYPTTDHGAYRLLGQAAELAVRTGAHRLIVKTVAESRRIPTIAENVAALEYAGRVADAILPTLPAGEIPAAGSATSRSLVGFGDSQTYAEARALVEAVLEVDQNVGRALLGAFARGLLDIPYCVHPDNAARTRSFIASDGRLCWADVGGLPLSRLVDTHHTRRITSADLLADLSYVRRTFDQPPERVLPGTPVDQGAIGV
ncbi:methylaspartate mutase [Kitasatospora sp. NPDC086801]|uniref:methylaspartate mutase n=1 Tax=Kitasatospora sp. NPDC086801 TaxID=3364066 RepID=UPI003810120B